MESEGREGAQTDWAGGGGAERKNRGEEDGQRNFLCLPPSTLPRLLFLSSPRPRVTVALSLLHACFSFLPSSPRHSPLRRRRRRRPEENKEALNSFLLAPSLLLLLLRLRPLLVFLFLSTPFPRLFPPLSSSLGGCGMENRDCPPPPPPPLYSPSLPVEPPNNVSKW